MKETTFQVIVLILLSLVFVVAILSNIKTEPNVKGGNDYKFLGKTIFSGKAKAQTAAATE
ncbi:MAG: hypothetical protein IKR41_11640 [Bacteroidales bacterium]|nr:hypothetical protein [Bacteroidales bacterium]